MTALADARAKLSRAEEHIRVLDVEIAHFLARDPYSVTREPHPHKTGYLFRVHVHREIPQPRWALLLGDCVHNARSALDHLAWRMAAANPADKATQFPIFMSRTLFDERSGRMMKNLSGRRHIAFIKWFQPHRRGDPGDLLWILQALDATDKHQLVLPVANFYGALDPLIVVPPKTYIG